MLYVSLHQECKYLAFFLHVFYTQVVGVGVDVNVALGLNVGGFQIVDVGGGGGDCD